MTAQRSALYFGTVAHQRLRPRRHALGYRMFSALIDLGELPTLTQSCRLFSHNRFNVFSFYDRDHGGGGAALRPWVEAQLAEAGITLGAQGSIELLSSPRMFGYAFNPLTVYFCWENPGQLAAILYEVNNTFGQRHTYVITAGLGADRLVRQSCSKRFYVSPFLEMAMTYHFRIMPPAQTTAITIAAHDRDGPVLLASFCGQRRSLTDASLMKALLLFPLATFKVVAAIHWQALKLFLKGVPLVKRPPAPNHTATFVTDAGE